MTDVTAIAAIRADLQQSRQAAIAQYRQAIRPDTLLSALCRSADQALRQLLELYPLPKGAALVAVGGYGRGELYPFSDVDLLIILKHDLDAQGEATLGGLVAAMWDVGLEPGYSVRTIEQCVKEARADITVETSLLESRWLAGSKTLAKLFEKTIAERLDPQQFFEQNAQRCNSATPATKTRPTRLNQIAKNRLAACAIYKSLCGWPGLRALAQAGKRLHARSC
jgi:[protein-PII] uridylyltransferase